MPRYEESTAAEFQVSYVVVYTMARGLKNPRHGIGSD
jgi:hypothetical protein